MSTSKVKNVVIPTVEVENVDEAWIQTTTARVLKNESYKVNKVGVKEDESGIVLEAVNIFSKNIRKNILKTTLHYSTLIVLIVSGRLAGFFILNASDKSGV